MKKKIFIVISYFILIINFSYAETINLENPNFDKEIYIPKKKIIEKIINENVNLWYGVYISNKKVGWFNGIYNKFNDDLYKIEEKLYLLMDIPGLEEGSKITMESETTYSMYYESIFPYRIVKYNELTTDNEGNEYSKKGFLKDDIFYLNIKNNNNEHEYKIKNLSQSLNDHLSLDAWAQESLRNKKDTIISKFFDFEELSYLKYVFTIKDIIKTKVNGLDYTYYKVNLDQKNVRNGDMQLNAEYLIDLKGKYLNFNMMEIFEFRSENEDEAKNLDKNSKFFLNAGIDLNNKLPDEIYTKDVESINYELTGDGNAIYNGGLQKVTKISNDKYLVEVGSPQLLEKVSNNDVNFYLKSSSRYPSNSSKIINFAKKVINNEKSDELKIEKLMNFVSEYIEDDYESNSESVLDIIDKKKGDCTEHSLLFTTMARSIGLPTREVTGWAYDGNKKYVLHAWVEVAMNVDNVFYWVPIDPTWNLSIPLIHIKSSGKNFINNNLSINLKEINFTDGERLNF
tara:strand:+ start:476 stop:2014 length:1539 start_codon:yes stop_codon:yes gene_type:complete